MARHALNQTYEELFRSGNNEEFRVNDDPSTVGSYAFMEAQTVVLELDDPTIELDRVELGQAGERIVDDELEAAFRALKTVFDADPGTRVRFMQPGREVIAVPLDREA